MNKILNAVKEKFNIAGYVRISVDDELDRDNVSRLYVEDYFSKHNLLIGARTAEDIKIKIGSAFPYDGEAAINIKGTGQVLASRS